jgi:putative transposase
MRIPASPFGYAAGMPPALPVRVTAPRQVLPGKTYLVTRRCSERRFFLRPSPLTNAIFLYVLAVAARLHRIEVHAWCVLSNHYHLVVTDPEARLPAFMQYLDSLVARALNASLGRWEGFWSTDNSYSAVVPIAPEDVVRKVAYVLANPVAAGLVRCAREWPGLWTAPEQLGSGAFIAPRPKVFFSPKGSMPGSAELVLTTPPGFSSAEEFQALIADALRDLEVQHQREADEDQRGFLGRSRVLAQRPFARPAPGEPRRQLNPRIAARDKWKRIEALSRLAEFLNAYRRAWKAFRCGAVKVVFPAGTYQLRVDYGVPCAAPT